MSLVLVLSGYGGEYDSLSPQISNGDRDTVGVGSTFPEKEDGNWKYSSVSNEYGVFSLSARIDATNTYTVPKYPSLKQQS